MSKLLELYEAYYKKLQEALSAYDELENEENNLIDFLNEQRTLYDQYELRLLRSVSLSEDLSSMKRKSKPADEIQAKEAAISENQSCLDGFENQMHWLKEPMALTDWIREGRCSDIDRYMRAFIKVNNLGKSLVSLQTEIRNNQNPKDPDALLWSQRHIQPILPTLLTKQGKIGQCCYRLLEAYELAVGYYLKILVKEQYQQGFEEGRYGLQELARFADLRMEKQRYYKGLLPEYIKNELPEDVYITGKRDFLGLGKTNTKEKLLKIGVFLKTYTGSEETFKNELKKLFAAVNIALDEGGLSRIYLDWKSASRSLESMSAADAAAGLHRVEPLTLVDSQRREGLSPVRSPRNDDEEKEVYSDSDADTGPPSEPLPLTPPQRTQEMRANLLLLTEDGLHDEQPPREPLPPIPLSRT